MNAMSLWGGFRGYLQAALLGVFLAAAVSGTAAILGMRLTPQLLEDTEVHLALLAFIAVLYLLIRGMPYYTERHLALYLGSPSSSEVVLRDAKVLEDATVHMSVALERLRKDIAEASRSPVVSGRFEDQSSRIAVELGAQAKYVEEMRQVIDALTKNTELQYNDARRTELVLRLGGLADLLARRIEILKIEWKMRELRS